MPPDTDLLPEMTRRSEAVQFFFEAPPPAYVPPDEPLKRFIVVSQYGHTFVVDTYNEEDVMKRVLKYFGQTSPGYRFNVYSLPPTFETPCVARLNTAGV